MDHCYAIRFCRGCLAKLILYKQRNEKQAWKTHQFKTFLLWNITVFSDAMAALSATPNLLSLNIFT